MAALKLQLEWGADEALDEVAIDRARPPAPRPALPPKPAPAPLTKPTLLAPAARIGAVAKAQSVAEAASTIEALRAAIAGFTDCPLAATATNMVFADGNPAAGLVFVGEAPGADEDRLGRPFVGVSGQLLDRMLASIGLDRTKFLITNLIPWRPPGNRPPTDSEVQTCLPFLLRHLALLQPRVVVTLGALSTKALTGRNDGIRKLRGRWHGISITGLEAPIQLLPTLHPAYLLRMPGAKSEAWLDLLTLKRFLDQR